jgi:periplasmic divalent cation tolerance protein
MKDTYGVVLTTFPDAGVAAQVVDGLLERRLAACVQTVPIQSTYRWKGAVQREAEVLALAKIRIARYPEVEAYIRSVHSYEIPEIILLPIAAGLPGYLRWIDDETD